jgi:hypothetical protein
MSVALFKITGDRLILDILLEGNRPRQQLSSPSQMDGIIWRSARDGLAAGRATTSTAATGDPRREEEKYRYHNDPDIVFARGIFFSDLESSEGTGTYEDDSRESTGDRMELTSHRSHAGAGEGSRQRISRAFSTHDTQLPDLDGPKGDEVPNDDPVSGFDEMDTEMMEVVSMSVGSAETERDDDGKTVPCEESHEWDSRPLPATSKGSPDGSDLGEDQQRTSSV